MEPESSSTNDPELKPDGPPVEKPLEPEILEIPVTGIPPGPWKRAMQRLYRPAHPIWIFLLGAALLGGLFGIEHFLTQRVAEQRARLYGLTQTDQTLQSAQERFDALSELKNQDMMQFKQGFGNMARTRKSLFESGLSVQEEKRLLDKQLEIMTTALMINPALQRVFIMKEGQPMQSYLLSYFPLKAFGGAPMALPPGTIRVTSKERFAHPERGKSEVVAGKLQWTPPQVGTSVRSNALGEFVVFTNSPIIFHGPPLNPEDHEKFPHICLGLDRNAARRIYRDSFIGTRVIVNNAQISQ